jgi:hypothetical protein
MDAYTILQEIKVLDDHRVEFRYLVNEQGKQLTSGLSQCAMRTAAVKAMQGNPLAVAIAERDLSVEHVYNDASGNRILSYTIDREVLAGRQPLQGTSQSNPFDVTTVSTAATNDAVENDVSSAVAAEPGSEPVPVDTPDITPAETIPPMPQQFKSPLRSKDNPAGVQANPYFDTP